MMAKLIYFAIFALCLSVCVGQIVQSGQCDPGIPLVDHFSLERFVGTWYEIHRAESPEQNTDCATFDITSSSNNINVYHTGVNDNFQQDSSGTATLAEGTAKITLDISMFDGPMDFWVLLTDYDNFAVTYSCENVSLTQRSIYLWILGRGKTFPNELMPAHITTTLNTLFGVNLNNLKAIDHSDAACHVLPTIEPGQNVILPGQCDTNIPIQQNFNVSRYTGLWYVVESYSTPLQAGSCNSVEYALDSNDTIQVKNTQIVNYLLETTIGSAVVATDDTSAKLDVTFNIDGVDVTNEYWVLSTDYNSYALVYSCKNINSEFRSVFSGKLSRTRTLTIAANNAINSIIKSIQVLNQQYYIVRGHSQADCFYYPDNNGGDVLLPGQCVESSAVPAVTEFDANLFAGTWYETSRYPLAIQPGGCVATEYTAGSSNTYTITQTRVNDERQIITTMQATLASDSRGVITATFNGVPFSNIFILTTDYTDYALAYSCRNINGQKHIYSWKLSRSRSGLSSAANTVINQLISDNIDLWEGYYIATGQDNDACFYYPVFDQTPSYIELPGPCPTTIRGVPDFDRNAYLGRWFEIARYPRTEQIGQCNRVEYSVSEQITVSNTEVADLALLTQTGFVNVSTGGSGQLNVEFSIDGEIRTINYYIIATDYTSYSLVYSCTNTDNGFSRVSSWKLSRTPTLNAQVAAAMTPAIASTQGLIEEYYQTTSQADEDCFYVPSVNVDIAPVFRGQCENITGVEGFDARRYLGWWHEIESYPIDGTAGDCRSSEYIQDGSTYKVVDTQFQNNEGLLVTGTVTITGDGKLRRTMAGKPDQDVWVLSTDYETYALLYSCQNLNDEYKTVWSAKHSKSRTLTQAAQNTMAPVIANNDVLYDQFYLNVDQSDAACFHYPTITEGQIIIPGQCDLNIPVVRNFSAVDFAGIWYQVERYDEVEGSSCVGSRYIVNEDSGSIYVLNVEVIYGELHIIETTARLAAIDESATINFTCPVADSEDATIDTSVSILATDYTSYALAYNCVNVNAFQRKVRAWKLSRSRTLSAEGVVSINSLIQQRQELHQPYFKEVEQHDECPEPSSALIIKNSIIVLLVCAMLQGIL